MRLLSRLRFLLRHPRVALSSLLLGDSIPVEVQRLEDASQALREAGEPNPLEDLLEYLPLPRYAVATKMVCAVQFVACHWKLANPRDPEAVRAFWATSVDNLYLLAYHNTVSAEYRRLLNLTAGEVGSACLNLGGGIGSEAIHLARQGNRVVYCDLEDSPVWRFARWRMKHHGLSVELQPEPPAAGSFDVVVAFDVFQLMDAALLESVLRRLTATLVPGGRLYCQSQFDYLERHRHRLKQGACWDALYSQHRNHQELWDRLTAELGLERRHENLYVRRAPTGS